MKRICDVCGKREAPLENKAVDNLGNLMYLCTICWKENDMEREE